MTFNVRLPLAADGPNRWENRREIAVAAIRQQTPDLIGTQELYQEQGDFLVERLPDFAWFGISRVGNHDDEHTAIFYRKSRFELSDSGNFWLSETPDQPGSIGRGMDLPRMATWGEFRDKTTRREFRFYNTHFPHRDGDEEARSRCARQIAQHLRSLPPGGTAILAGDFNAGLSSEAHRILTEQLSDAFLEVAHPAGPGETFHDFTGKPEGRIDWILYRGALKAASVETVAFHEGGRYPSDHFPVVAAFEWK